MSENTLFKGRMPQPKMGVQPKEDEWYRSTPWQPGTVPGKPRGSGFNPVYVANDVDPFKHAESNSNFSLRKKAE